MVTFLIYLMVMSETFSNALLSGATAGAVVVAISAVVCLFWFIIDNAKASDGLIRFIKIIKRAFVTTVALFLLAVVIPNERQMAIIVGTSAGYHLITSDPAKRIGNKALLLLEQKINEALADEVAKPVEKGGTAT